MEGRVNHFLSILNLNDIDDVFELENDFLTYFILFCDFILNEMENELHRTR